MNKEVKETLANHINNLENRGKIISVSRKNNGRNRILCVKNIEKQSPSSSQSKKPFMVKSRFSVAQQKLRNNAKKDILNQSPVYVHNQFDSNNNKILVKKMNECVTRKNIGERY